MPKFKNISATVVYTVEYHVDLEGEYDCLDEAEAEIVRLADHYLHHAIAPDPTHEEVCHLTYDEEESEEEECTST